MIFFFAIPSSLKKSFEFRVSSFGLNDLFLA